VHTEQLLPAREELEAELRCQEGLAWLPELAEAVAAAWEGFGGALPPSVAAAQEVGLRRVAPVQGLLEQLRGRLGCERWAAVEERLRQALLAEQGMRGRCSVMLVGGRVTVRV
jgi:hypothetical protein